MPYVKIGLSMKKLRKKQKAPKSVYDTRGVISFHSGRTGQAVSLLVQEFDRRYGATLPDV